MKYSNEVIRLLCNNLIEEIVFVRHSVHELNKNKNLTPEFINSYQKMTNGIEEAFIRISKLITCYNNPYDFQTNIKRHKNSVVVSIWGVGGSRNKKALIPSICESSNIAYVGGDTHIQALCQDKYLSNLYAKAHNILAPNQVLFTNNSLINYKLLFMSLNYPVIVKPLIEGESIGISSSNVCHTLSTALSKALELNELFKQDILIEEMLQGDEVNILLTGINSQIDIFCEVKIIHDEDTIDSIYTYDKKRVADSSGVMTKIGNYVNEETKKHIKTLYNNLKNAEILRVDGRILNGEFKLIEFTQDPGLSFEGLVHRAFKHNGYSYDAMLKYLLNNAITNHRKY